jgi:hypothetical protein
MGNKDMALASCRGMREHRPGTHGWTWEFMDIDGHKTRIQNLVSVHSYNTKCSERAAIPLLFCVGPRGRGVGMEGQ